MAQILLFSLILANAYVGLAMANMVQSSSAPFPNPTAPTPSNIVEAPPMIRKLGKHQLKVTKSSGVINPPALSPSMEAATQENVSVLVQEIHQRKPDHSVDKSVAGGGVIIGGLATTFLVAIFCYIRATRRSHKAAETIASSSSNVASPSASM
ncbi:hypothetical protein FNV43_RR09627 [Rhamnella rubrinervis]|uniref:Uncharacterized protein n=1 Tax=Rhamnella rubrinervis TaxID=2594499 RepID=A0A8K0MKJ3_9ROSA|nr:hypothetical protein FNV43_RR09627 [Rhamnella rubrinervis]